MKQWIIILSASIRKSDPSICYLYFRSNFLDIKKLKVKG